MSTSYTDSLTHSAISAFSSEPISPVDYWLVLSVTVDERNPHRYASLASVRPTLTISGEPFSDYMSGINLGPNMLKLESQGCSALAPDYIEIL